MTYTADPRVDAYIDTLPEWQQIICRHVRTLVHAADPDVIETIKFSNRPYFVLQGNICALLAAKDHVNIFLYDGAIVPDPEGIITGGHTNTTARTMVAQPGCDTRGLDTAPRVRWLPMPHPSSYRAHYLVGGAPRSPAACGVSSRATLPRRVGHAICAPLRRQRPQLEPGCG